MFKKLIIWFVFTIFAGLLPIVFVWLACEMTSTDFAYDIISSEIFFFNIIVTANGIKEVFDIKEHKKLKNLFMCILIIFLIVFSGIYGMLLLNDYAVNLELQLDHIYSSMITVTIGCVATNLCIQVIGGLEDNE